jgi:hypothetical protein
MILHGSLKINGTACAAGSEIAWYKVYPFFLLHMFMFGGSGFLLAYADASTPLFFLFLHGGFAIFVYTMFYLSIFGRDEVKWMFINAGLGALGIYTQLDWLLSFFGKSAAEYPLTRHIVPFLYYVLYTFLLRQALLDISASRENEGRRRLVETGYVALSLAASAACYLLNR